MPTYQQHLRIVVGNVHAVMRLLRRDKPPWPAIAAALPATVHRQAVLWERLARQALDPAHAWDESDLPQLPKPAAADARAAIAAAHKDLDALATSIAAKDAAAIAAALRSLIQALGPLFAQAGRAIVADAYPGAEEPILVSPETYADSHGNKL
jgi:hypothetical protein